MSQTPEAKTAADHEPVAPDPSDCWEPPPAEVGHLPMIPLSAPRMPPLGPDFVALADAYGEASAPPAVIDGHKFCQSAGPKVTALYKQALYDRHFDLNVRCGPHPRHFLFIPGHLWLAPEVAGPRKARVMLIGKCLGQADWAMLRHFAIKTMRVAGRQVDSPGRVLLRVLETDFGPGTDLYLRPDGDLGYRTWYVTDLVRFYPEGREGRLQANWVADCLPLLHLDLRLVRPDFIMTFGTEATEALLGKGHGVQSVGGKVFDYAIPLHESHVVPRVHVAKLVPCLHPAAVAKAPDKRPEMIRALRRFAQLLLDRPAVPASARVIDHRDLHTARDLAKVVEMIHADPDGDVIAVDCEWHGETAYQPNSYLRTIHFSHKPGYAYCVVLRREMEREDPDDWLTARDDVIPPNAFGPTQDHARKLLHRLFCERPDGKKVRVIGHNFKADEGRLRHWGLDLRPLFEAPPDDPDLGTNPDALPGWAKTVNEGGFDTMLALHAVQETADLKLEVCCSNLLDGVERWDGEIQQLKKEWCRSRKIPEKNLEGFGPFPGEKLFPYGKYDVDFDRQLFDLLNKEGGLLDKDAHGNCSRVAFWVAMRATLAFGEMVINGLEIDRHRVDQLTALYLSVEERLEQKLKELTNWQDFSAGSHPKCRALLFGPSMARVYDNKTGEPKDLIALARRFNEDDPAIHHLQLTAVKTTGKPAQSWGRITERGDTEKYTPSTDKESLGILRGQAAEQYGVGSREEQIVETLRQLRFVGQTLQGALARPKGTEFIPDEDGEDEEFNTYERGIPYFVQDNGRVHTHLYQTQETGRTSSSRPALQNLSSKREADYESIIKGVGSVYQWPLRSIVKFAYDPWGHPVVGCEHDLAGTELLMMAVQSGDQKMIDHCERNVLPEEGFNADGTPNPKGKYPHPNYYDIHSSIAVKAFKLHIDTEKAAQELGLRIGDPCPPTKGALRNGGEKTVRVGNDLLKPLSATIS